MLIGTWLTLLLPPLAAHLTLTAFLLLLAAASFLIAPRIVALVLLVCHFGILLGSRNWDRPYNTQWLECVPPQNATLLP